MTKKYIAAHFASNPFKSYHFVTDIDGLEEDDFVAVETSNGYQIVQVEGYIDIPKVESKNLKWVIQKIDMQQHRERIKKEQQLNTLLQKMEMRQKELEKVSLFKLLAETDPSMRAMFEEYQNLANN